MIAHVLDIEVTHEPDDRQMSTLPKWRRRMTLTLELDANDAATLAWLEQQRLGSAVEVTETVTSERLYGPANAR